MLNTTTHELVFIRACVYLLRYAPLFYLILPPFISIPALLIELSYYVLIWRRFASRHATAAKHPLDTRQEREALFDRCLQNIPDINKYLSLWALGADIKDIKRDNVRDFLLWAFFDREDAGDDQDISDELESYITKTEAMLGRPLPIGRGNSKPLRLTFDKIQTQYRSYVWYLIIGLIDVVTHVRMLWAGFKFYAASSHANLTHAFPPRPLACLERLLRHSPCSEISYWFRPAVNRSKPTLPIVFLHGIGIGLYPYVPFLSSVPAASPVLALEILPISMRLTAADMVGRPEFLRHFKEILQNHGIDRFVLIGHSYGSVLTTHILHDSELAPRVEGVVLVDPVTLLLHLPTVAYNFTRRMPRTANEWQLWYLASMDPGIALVLGRHFFWRENIIWKDELLHKDGSAKRRVAVCLASRDLIVDTQSVARYLVSNTGLTDQARNCSPRQDDALITAFDKGFTTTDSGIDLLWFTGLDHAQVFDTPQRFGRVLKLVEQFCAYT